MTPLRRRLGLGWLVVALSLPAVLSTARPAEKGHPRLVSEAATRCSTCHQALFQGKENVHAPAEDDCTTCHEVQIDEEGTRITLMDREPALCVMCHSDLEAAAAFELEAPHAPVGDSCLSCHAPHASAQARLLTAPAAELCATCHDTAELQEAHGGQLTAKVDCLSCHVPHGSETPRMLAGTTVHAPFADRTCEACHRAPFAGRVRLVRRGQRLCTSCHSDLENPAPEGGSRHAALEGTRRTGGCQSCHDPHMSANAKLLVNDGPRLCSDCHTEIVSGATADTGHLPAAEDCMTCHQPHAAAQPRLLSDEATVLCHMCHDPEDAELGRAHLGADLTTLECTSCHTPHGNGNPSLLARHVHPVILDGCATCHVDSASELLEDGESALCLACHVDVEQTAKAAAVTHDALDLVRCADCHNAHASPRRMLLSQPAGGECLLCHDQQGPGQGETIHGAVTLVGCGACHEPHGGSRPKLLRAEGNALCLGCHSREGLVAQGEGGAVRLADRFEISAAEAGAISLLRLSRDGERGHPLPGHPVVGTVQSDPHSGKGPVTFEGNLSCLACHDPHKGRSAGLFRWNAASRGEACLHCHPK